MTRRWNGKALIDELGARVWDNSDSSLARIIGWVNEIQDDIASSLPIDRYKFELKKLLPADQEIISLRVPVPTAPTAAIAAGGNLTDGSSYKVYTSFLVYDSDSRDYIESEATLSSAAVTADATNKTIDLTDIDIMEGSTSYEPTTIYRRIYLSVDSGSGYGEPFFIADIADNTTTTYSITAESSSTITPVSDSEIERIAPDHPRFRASGKVLFKIDRSQSLRFNPTGSNSSTPDSFDYVGQDRIFLYPKLATTSTENERTLNYSVFRRPHEVFYEVDRVIDLPIIAKRALKEGVAWLAYQYKDRAGKESLQQNYEVLKGQLLRKLKRQQGAPSSVRDVNGDWSGFEV